MLRKLIGWFLRHAALNHGSLVTLYRKFCAPRGEEWVLYLQRHGRLQAIGEGCVIQSNVTITDPQYVRIGNNVHLTGCTLFCHDGSVAMLKAAYGVQLDSVGKIDIHDNVFVGHQAIIMPGVTIGENSIVAAGSLVTRDVMPGTVVAGIPARPITTTEEHLAKLQAQFQTLKWRNHPHMATDFFGPPDASLDQARIEHFFGTPA